MIHPDNRSHLFRSSVELRELQKRDSSQLPAQRCFDHFAVHGEDPRKRRHSATSSDATVVVVPGGCIRRLNVVTDWCHGFVAPVFLVLRPFHRRAALDHLLGYGGVRKREEVILWVVDSIRGDKVVTDRSGRRRSTATQFFFVVVLCFCSSFC
jgi:hypothetical protein